jgi:hypothetical protein
MSPELCLGVRADWKEVEAVRERTAAFLRDHHQDALVVDAVAMVTGELTENAQKYGTFGSARDLIEVSVAISSASVTVEVKNPIPKGHDLARLDGMIQWIRGFADPFEAYLERLKDVSAQTLDSEESGLGLVRIAYEGHAILDFFVDARSTLAVSAVHLR